MQRDTDDEASQCLRFSQRIEIAKKPEKNVLQRVFQLRRPAEPSLQNPPHLGRMLLPDARGRIADARLGRCDERAVVVQCRSGSHRWQTLSTVRDYPTPLPSPAGAEHPFGGEPREAWEKITELGTERAPGKRDVEHELERARFEHAKQSRFDLFQCQRSPSTERHCSL